MTTLNSRLQLAMLNRKKARNALEKGFTLVELMIVIVIVGILSAVALPNFLNQTDKAKGTECTTKLGSLLSTGGAEALADKAIPEAIKLKDDENTNSTLCTFTITAPTAAGIIDATAVGKTGGDLEGTFAANGCINYKTGKRDIKSVTGASATAGAAVCT